jgi:hypothetical protein
MADDAVLRKCEELLEMLYEHDGHAKLRALIRDIERLRDSLLERRRVGESGATVDP